ncbi:MAG: protein kinase [Myxococcales bacterium]|nr:protein kinase [Myxococcales bacterium]
MDAGSANHIATCPVCGAHGPIGQPCTTKRCQKRGYHFVPPGYLVEDDVVDGIVGQRWGDFLIVRRVTEGGVGAIYLALQMPLMMKAAVKILATDAPASLADRLQHEAAALARLSHPNIVRLLNYGESGRRAYMVMEYVDGGRTLADAMERGELDRPASLRVLRQLIGALDAAHRHQVVHRDIKPQNVMLQRLPDNPDFVRLVDFGLVKFTDTGRESTMIAAGTPTYMAPEQISRQGIGPWTDWYAVAMLAAEMLLDHRPFTNVPTDDVIRQKLRPDFDASAQLVARGLPAPVLAFFRQALANDPARRLRTTQEFRDGFEAMAAALPALEATHRPVARPISLAPPAAAPARPSIDRAALAASIASIPDPEEFDPDSTMRTDDGASILAAREAQRKRHRERVEDDEPTTRSRLWPAEAPITEKGLLADRVPTAPIPPVASEDDATEIAPIEPAPARPSPSRPVASQPVAAATPQAAAQSAAAKFAAAQSAAAQAVRRPAGARSHGAAGPPRGTPRAANHGRPRPTGAAPARPPQQREKTLLVSPIRDESSRPVAPPTRTFRNLLIVFVLIALGVLGAIVWLMVNPPRGQAEVDEPEPPSERIIIE